MPKVLNQQQIDEFHELGFISPIDVMSEDEAEHYRQRLEQAERDYPEQINPHNRNNCHLSIKCLDELAHHPVILDAVEDLIGENISLWGSVLFIKEPNTPHYVSWHQDATYMGMNRNHFVTPWLALTPSNLEMGCMSMIPGSHQKKIRHHDDQYGEDNILTRGQVVDGISAAEEKSAVDLILRPGQMSIHNAEVIHSSRPNTTSQRRIGYALQSYMPPSVWQVVGDNMWLHMRGHNPRPNSYQLSRPAFDLDPVAQADREKCDVNFSDILYHGAQQRRSY